MKQKTVEQKRKSLYVQTYVEDTSQKAGRWRNQTTTAAAQSEDKQQRYRPNGQTALDPLWLSQSNYCASGDTLGLNTNTKYSNVWL